MKRVLSTLIIASIAASCGSNGEVSVTPSDTIAVKKVDSLSGSVVIQPTYSFPSELTTDEIKDDSVFADGSEPASWEDAGIDNPAALKKFIRKLQRWVVIKEKDSLASVIAFPLLNAGVRDKKAMVIRDRKEFLSNYDIYFSDTVKAAIKNQNLRQIFRNANGAMIGNGQLWVGQAEVGFAITAINYK